MGTNPCNWAIIENRWGSEADVSTQQMLSEMKTSGYAATDLGDVGFFSTKSEDTSKVLSGKHLMGAFVEISLSSDEVPASELSSLETVCGLMAGVSASASCPSREGYPAHIVLADQGDSHTRQVNSGAITTEMGMTEGQKENFLKNLALVREAASRHGLPVYFHPHCGSRVETVEEIDWLVNNSDVKLVFDTGHLLYATGGQANLLELLERYGDRIGTFHFKDITEEGIALARKDKLTYLEAVKKGLVVNCGKGLVAKYFPDIVDWQKKKNYKGFVCVEQETFDRTKTEENMTINQRYLTDLYQGPIPAVLVGSGRMGFIHGKNLAASPHWDLRHVIDPNPETAKRCGDALGATVARDVAHAVAESGGKLRAAIICTPTPVHLQDIKACADLGLDIFIEKPIAVEEKDIVEAFDYCEKKGVLLYCGFHRRFDPALRKFQKDLRDSSWGPPELLHVFGRDAPCPPVEFLKTSGGIFHDLMIHHIDQAQWVMGSQVESLVGMTHTWTEELREIQPPVLEETAAVILKFKSGGMALIDNTRRAPRYDERMEAFSNGGVKRFGFDPLNPETHHMTEDPFVRFADGYRLEMDHLADLIRHPDIIQMEVTREQCIANSRIASQLMEAASNKTVINL